MMCYYLNVQFQGQMVKYSIIFGQSEVINGLRPKLTVSTVRTTVGNVADGEANCVWMPYCSSSTRWHSG